MILKYVSRYASMTAFLCVIGYSMASGRIWKATPAAVARDYATIHDVRPSGDIVTLMWFVPGMISPSTPGAAIASELLNKYVVIVAIHARVDKITGATSFDDITTLEVRDQTGGSLAVRARNDLPPNAIAMLAAMESTFRRSFGSMGKGVRMSVFDAGSVGYCKKGKLSVPLAGETYTWDTPFPGCAEK